MSAYPVLAHKPEHSPVRVDLPGIVPPLVLPVGSVGEPDALGNVILYFDNTGAGIYPHESAANEALAMFKRNNRCK